MAAVDWTNLAKAISHFEGRGYEYVEAPWHVPESVVLATCPNERYVITSSLGPLVGSAEQSFMHLRREGSIGAGKFVACTPCFRNEDVVNELWQRTFMKVELYLAVETAEFTPEIMAMVEEVLTFNRSLLEPEVADKLEVRVTGSHSFDIELGGIEIGSYGLRSWGEEHWIYGTALAEPRFSTAARLVSNSI